MFLFVDDGDRVVLGTDLFLLGLVVLHLRVHAVFDGRRERLLVFVGFHLLHLEIGVKAGLVVVRRLDEVHGIVTRLSQLFLGRRGAVDRGRRNRFGALVGKRGSHRRREERRGQKIFQRHGRASSW